LNGFQKHQNPFPVLVEEEEEEEEEEAECYVVGLRDWTLWLLRLARSYV
jgi:hypothetical protein